MDPLSKENVRNEAVGIHSSPTSEVSSASPASDRTPGISPNTTYGDTNSSAVKLQDASELQEVSTEELLPGDVSFETFRSQLLGAVTHEEPA